ncbi:MAG: OmpH family outer membrane protein [Solirubrobacterales bacterium]
MNGKMAVGGFLVCVLLSLGLLEYGRAAAPAAGPTLKVGVVSMKAVFQASAKHKQYAAGAMARQSQARMQLDNLKKEIEGDDAELKALKQGTPDYTQQLQVVLEKRAKMQSQQEFLKQQSVLEDKKWLEDLYQAFARATKALAQEKGLDMVLERTEPEFPIPSDELMSTLYMHKVLYAGGCVDLTTEVTARLDADETLKPQ